MLSSNRSMAVWCKARSPTSATDVQVHFNYWRLAGDTGFQFRRSLARDFVEVGVLVDDPNQLEEICIFVPQTLTADAVADCSEKFSDPNIAQGIFNEVLTATAAATAGPRCVVLKDNAGALFCRVHGFMTDADGLDPVELTIAPLADGSLLTITRAAIDEACRCAAPLGRSYFRLRIFLPSKCNSFVRLVPTPDRLLQSGFDEIEYLDFRVNEARTLPTLVENRMRLDQGVGTIALTLVAFLTAIPVRSALSMSNTPSHKMRLLEHPLWSGYAPNVPEGMVVYHWKRDNSQGKIADFTAFVKLQTRRSGKRILATYLLIAFLFGVFGNLVASWLESPIDKGIVQLFSSSRTKAPAAAKTPKPAPSSGSTAIASPTSAVGNVQ